LGAVSAAPYNYNVLKEKTLKVEVTARSLSTTKGIVRNGDVIELPDAEVNKIMKMNPLAFKKIAEEPVFKTANKKAPTKKKRARNANGTLKADDPSTPNVNEAYE